MQKTLKKQIATGILSAFLVNFWALPSVYAQELILPKPGQMVALSPKFNPPVLKGIKLDPDNPFRFQFYIDQGDSTKSSSKALVEEQFKPEANKLIKYFLASITTPETDLWVNLSPYEKDRIVPDAFGKTDMGRDLLAQDYILKQITASLMSPENEVGKKFWKRIYDEASKKYGTTNIPVNTFNKVWIIPEKAVVYENSKAGTAYVVESKLKVMLEADYLSLQKNHKIMSSPNALVGDPVITQTPTGSVPAPTPLTSVSGAAIKNDTLRPYQSSELEKLAPALYRAPASGPPVDNVNKLGESIIREIIIPELTQEINEGKNFAQLRQVYNSLILAHWYKKKIKESILVKVYANKNKVLGIKIDQGELNTEQIYQQYLHAFKKGVVNVIKEEINPISNQLVPRKYFSGGVLIDPDQAMVLTQDRAMVKPENLLMAVDVDVEMSSGMDLWRRIDLIDLPQDEDEQVEILQRLSMLKWTQMTSEGFAYLKAFVTHAAQLYPHYLNNSIIQNALNDKDDGVLELIRRSHPYTLAVLRDPSLDAYHYRMHEGMYYWLFTQKLLGRKSDKPTIVMNIDPHLDLMGVKTKDHISGEKGAYQLKVVGITDYNWASAALRDGLADAIIPARLVTTFEGVRWDFRVVANNRIGENGYDGIWSASDKYIDTLRALLEEYGDYQLFLTLDLDQFSLERYRHKKGPLFFDVEESANIFETFLDNLRIINFGTTLVTADSRDYLSQEANEHWIENMRIRLRQVYQDHKRAKHAVTLKTDVENVGMSANEGFSRRSDTINIDEDRAMNILSIDDFFHITEEIHKSPVLGLANFILYSRLQILDGIRSYKQQLRDLDLLLGSKIYDELVSGLEIFNKKIAEVDLIKKDSQNFIDGEEALARSAIESYLYAIANFKSEFRTISVFEQSLARSGREEAVLRTQPVQALLDQISRTRRNVWRLLEHSSSLASSRNIEDNWGIINPAVDINHLLRECVSLERGFIPAQFMAVQISYDLDKNIPKIAVDEARMINGLREVIRNAVLASVKKVEHGIYVPFRNTSHIEIKTRWVEKEQAIRIFISDNGVGISNERLKEVIFYGVSSGSQHGGVSFGGHGAGFPILLLSVSEHHGEVEIHSDVNEGTVIEIIIPKDTFKDNSDGDRAMSTPISYSDRFNPEGGINLDPAQMTFETKQDGENFHFNFNGVEIDAAQETGATFTIRKMTPVTDLSVILN